MCKFAEGLDYIKVAYDYWKISGLDSSNISLDIIITDNSEDLKKLVTIKLVSVSDGQKKGNSNIAKFNLEDITTTM